VGAVAICCVGGERLTGAGRIGRATAAARAKEVHAHLIDATSVGAPLVRPVIAHVVPPLVRRSPPPRLPSNVDPTQGRSRQGDRVTHDDEHTRRFFMPQAAWSGRPHGRRTAPKPVVAGRPRRGLGPEQSK
jgi:hypothetical protein